MEPIHPAVSTWNSASFSRPLHLLQLIDSSMDFPSGVVLCLLSLLWDLRGALVLFRVAPEEPPPRWAFGKSTGRTLIHLTPHTVFLKLVSLERRSHSFARKSTLRSHRRCATELIVLESGSLRSIFRMLRPIRNHSTAVFGIS